MINLDSIQQAIVSSPRKEDLSWLFTVSTQSGQTYRWSTKDKSFGDHLYAFKVIPDSFSGVRLNRARSEAGLQAPNTCNFHISNKDNALRASDFRGASALVDLVISNGTVESVIRSFRFAVLHCLPNYQRLEFSCQDFLQQFLRGSYPVDRLARDIFQSGDQDQTDEDITPPVPFGCAYPPLASVYAGDDRYLLLGEDDYQYELFRVHAPVDYASQIERSSGLGWGLMHYLTLDEGAGITATDATIFGNDGVLGGSGPGPLWVTSEYGRIGGAHLFYDVYSTGAVCGNANPLAAIGNPAAARFFRSGSSGFAFSFWMKLVGDNSTPVFIMHKAVDASHSITIGRGGTVFSGQFRVGINGAWHEFALSTDIFDAEWHLITVNFEQTGSAGWTVNVYVGSILEGTTAFVSIGADISNTGALIWGGDGAFGCCMVLDECRVYNHPLSVDEIAELEETTASFYVFNQASQTDSDGATWRLCQPIIADQNNDGVADSQGHFYASRSFLPPPVMLCRSDTWGTVNPADVIAHVLLDMGVDGANIDTGAGSTFEAASETYRGWGLEFHGAFFEKVSAAQALAMLLNQCNSVLDVGDKIQLRVRSRASRATITKANVIRQRKRPEDQERVSGEGTFKASAGTLSASDSGHVSWQRWGYPQDRALKTLVPAKFGKDSASGITLEMPFVHDSQQMQRLGSLVFQRLFLMESYRYFESKLSLVALQPDDVIRINAADYGGCFTALVDAMNIGREGYLDLTVLTYLGVSQSIRHGGYQWTLSGSGTIEFYCELSAGGDPGLREPDSVLMNGISRLQAALGSLSDYTWGYGDNDGLGFDTIYVRLTQGEVLGGVLYTGGDPDARPAGFIQGEYALDDYEDLDPDPVEVAEDNTNDFEIWKPATSGPSGIEVVQNLWAGMWDKICLTVSPTPNQGMFESIEAALAQVPSDGAKIYLKNGVYEHTGAIAIPDRNILIEGESQGGVALQNHAGDDLFILHNPTGLVAFRNFSIKSQNTSTYSKMFHFYGDTAAANTAQVLIDEVNFDLADAGSYMGNGDYGIYGHLSQGLIKINLCFLDGGQYPVYLDTYGVVEISNCDVLNAIYNAIYVESGEYAIFSNRVKDFWYRGIQAGIASTGEQSAILSNRLTSRDIAANSAQTGILCNGIGGRVAENTVIMTNIPASAGTALMNGISDYRSTAMNGNTVKIYAKTTSIVCIWVGDDSQASGNIVLYDPNGVTTGAKTGLQVYGDRAIVMNNQVNGTGDALTDYGIILQSTASNCFVVNNLLANVGTTISNSGTGNTTSPNKGV